MLTQAVCAGQDVVTALQRWSGNVHKQEDMEVIMACPVLAPEVKRAMVNPDPQVTWWHLHRLAANRSESCLLHAG